MAKLSALIILGKGGTDLEKEVTVQVEVEGIEEMIKKAERYVELLEEAKTLADELASVELKIRTNS